MATTEKVIHNETDSSLTTTMYGGVLIAFKGKKALSDKSFIGFYRDCGEKVILDTPPSTDIQKLLDDGYTQIMHDLTTGKGRGKDRGCLYYYIVNES